MSLTQAPRLNEKFHTLDLPEMLPVFRKREKARILDKIGIESAIRKGKLKEVKGGLTVVHEGKGVVKVVRIDDIKVQPKENDPFSFVIITNTEWIHKGKTVLIPEQISGMLIHYSLRAR